MRGIVLAVTVLVGLLLLRYARRYLSILLTMVVFAAFVTADLLLAQNAYYGTYPTVREWLAGTPADEAKEPLPAVPDEGMILPVRIPGERSGFAARPALVYLPRAWSAEPRPALPVLMLLHGSPGTPQEWIDGAGVAGVAQAWAQRYGGVAPVLVMPDVTGEAGLGVCADTPAGNVETYLAGDVPAFLQEEFGTAGPGAKWAVAGHGSGGTCAVTLGLRHPDLFPTFAAFGATAAVTDPQHDPAMLLAGRTYPGSAAWLADTAPPAGMTAQLVGLARSAGIAACQVTSAGAPPGLATWGAQLAEALPWLAARTGLVPETPELTAVCDPPAG
ncbi:MAG: alpha/beta hydrolase [Pseudonocardia sp.]